MVTVCAVELKKVYEKAHENYRRDVRLGLMPNEPFHTSDEQVTYLDEVMACREEGVNYEREKFEDSEFHKPVDVEEPYDGVYDALEGRR